MRDPDGSIYYLCPICQDSGFVHPRREDGKPDYSKVKPCRCRQASAEPEIFDSKKGANK